MTEKTAQEIIELLTLNGRKPEHIKNGERVVYLSDAISIVKKALTNDTPPFAVGEYYVTNGLTYKVISGDKKDQIQTLFLINGALVKSSRSLKDDTFKNSTPATAEQIATFKRAEQFAAKGRKLDEFRDRDLVKYEGELFFAKTTSESNLISVCGFDGYGWDDMNADEFTLIQTAEELQGNQKCLE